jgi:hypothetical protein
MATKWRLSYQKDIAGGLYPNSDCIKWRFHTIKYRYRDEVSDYLLNLINTIFVYQNLATKPFFVNRKSTLYQQSVAKKFIRI